MARLQGVDGGIRHQSVFARDHPRPEAETVWTQHSST